MIVSRCFLCVAVEQHFNVRDAVFEEFIRCLAKALLRIEGDGIGLRFDPDALGGEFFFGSGDACLNHLGAQSAAAAQGDHAAQHDFTALIAAINDA